MPEITNMSRDDADWLATLHVSETEDEFGKDRFFIEDKDGNWVSDPFDTIEEAQFAIAKWQENG